MERLVAQAIVDGVIAGGDVDQERGLVGDHLAVDGDGGAGGGDDLKMAGELRELVDLRARVLLVALSLDLRVALELPKMPERFDGVAGALLGDREVPQDL